MSRRSVTGYFIQLDQLPISWRTKKQDVVSRSSVEAEYRAMANATSDIVWLRNLMATLGFSVPPATIHCDNQASLHIVTNPAFPGRTKHIEVDCHFV